MSQLFIRFNDNANGIFYVGQKMSGTVELYLPDTKYCRGLRLTIEGSAICKWTKKIGSETMVYEGLEQYMNFTTFLFGSKDGESIIIEAGVNHYSFSCILPLELPYSVETTHGSIRYKVEANLDISWGLCAKMIKEFTICRHDDLNLYRELAIPCEKEVTRTFCCLFCESKPVLLEVSIPHSGYIPGDTINVAIRIINKSNRTVSKCKIELIRNTKYTSDKFKTKYETKVMLKVEAQGVEKRTTAHFIKELIVPLILKNTNTMHCDVLQITYELKVTCVIAGRLVDAEVSFPITLGSVPLNFGEADQLSNSSNDIAPPSFEESMEKLN